MSDQLSMWSPYDISVEKRRDASRRATLPTKMDGTLAQYVPDYLHALLARAQTELEPLRTNFQKVQSHEQ